MSWKSPALEEPSWSGDPSGRCCNVRCIATRESYGQSGDKQRIRDPHLEPRKFPFLAARVLSLSPQSVQDTCGLGHVGDKREGGARDACQHARTERGRIRG